MKRKRKRHGSQSSRRLRFEALEVRNLLATLIWEGDHGTAPEAFHEAANWDSGSVPTRFDDVTFNKTDAVQVKEMDAAVFDFDVVKDNLTVALMKNLTSRNVTVGADAVASVTLNGAQESPNDTWTFTQLSVGAANDSTFTVQGGATAKSTRGYDPLAFPDPVISIGSDVAKGHLIVENATLDLTSIAGPDNGDLYGNSGSIAVTGGNVTTGLTYLGVEDRFAVTLTDQFGISSTWENTDDLLVGAARVATLEIESIYGKPVELHTHGDAAVDTFMGAAGDESRVTITNDGAHWQIDGKLNVQSTAAKSSTVSVQNGGSITVLDRTSIGFASKGTLAINGHGSLVNVAELIVGQLVGSDGTITITADGLLESLDATIGQHVGASGEVDIDGGNWQVCGDIQVGATGHGELAVSNGLVEVL